jgi:hypothetical protein
MSHQANKVVSNEINIESELENLQNVWQRDFNLMS